MAQHFKYNTGSTITNTTQKGNISIATSGTYDWGPTSSTGFYPETSAPSNGYTIYYMRSSGGPSVHVATNDAHAITFLKSFGATGSTISETLSWASGQSDYYVQTGDTTATLVTSGLTLNLDASNPSSYPGTGTTWYDLSGNGYDGTLINSPTYSSSNGGYFTFNGSNQRVTNSSMNTITGNTYRTMGGWIKGTTTENIPFALGNSPAYNAPNKGFGVNLATTTTVSVYGISGYYDETGITSSGLLSGNWSYLVITWDGTSIRVYCNGTLTGTRVRSSGAYDSLSGYFVGTWTNLDRFYNGYISTFAAYNRALSGSEILQNYNATKTRFGL